MPHPDVRVSSLRPVPQRRRRRLAGRGLLLTALVATCSVGVMAAPAWAADPSPVASASPDGLVAPGILGAQEEVVRDDFDEAADWVDLGADENGRTSLEEGRLFMSIKGRDINYRD
jgi:hypothetical protein